MTHGYKGENANGERVIKRIRLRQMKSLNFPKFFCHTPVLFSSSLLYFDVKVGFVALRFTGMVSALETSS